MARIAQTLAMSSDAGIRDPVAAFELARRASTLNPNDAQVWATLGLACCRTGRWSAGIEAMDKSMQLQTGADASTWLLLAVAHSKLGHGDEAMKWYGQAIDWIEKRKSRDIELRRFRDEAATVLSEPDASQPPVKKEETAKRPAKP